MKPISGKRFVLEGTWSGYGSGQARVAHREVISAKRAAALDGLTIQYTDGTCLCLTARPAALREKIIPLLGYSDLIYRAQDSGLRFVTVAQLTAIRAEKRAAYAAKLAAASA